MYRRDWHDHVVQNDVSLRPSDAMVSKCVPNKSKILLFWEPQFNFYVELKGEGFLKVNIMISFYSLGLCVC